METAKPVVMKNILDYIAFFECKYGDLNYLFYHIFEGRVNKAELTELLYYYDMLYGLDIDMEEYIARYGEIPFEKQLEKLKLVAREICQAKGIKKIEKTPYSID